MRANGRPRTARQKYGEELRLRRLAVGLTQEALAEQVVCSPTLISHYEAGRRLPSPDDARRIDRALGTDGFFERWLEDLDPAFAHYFGVVAELEHEVTEIRHYGGSLIPGLLQTKAYSRAVFEAYRPNYFAEELDELVVSRTKRALLLDKPSAPATWILVDEGALRRRVGGPKVMAEQLHRWRTWPIPVGSACMCCPSHAELTLSWRACSTCCPSRTPLHWRTSRGFTTGACWTIRRWLPPATPPTLSP